MSVQAGIPLQSAHVAPSVVVIVGKMEVEMQVPLAAVQE